MFSNRVSYLKNFIFHKIKFVKIPHKFMKMESVYLQSTFYIKVS